MAEISETKTPKPGEYWVRHSGGMIFYVVGFNPDGSVVHHNKDLGLFTRQMRFFCREFRHEPRCTGFGWLPVTEESSATAADHWSDTAYIQLDSVAEHTQQIRELMQRIGELVQKVNERDAVIEKIRTALHANYYV